jgi:hypothetical protein
MPGEEDDSNIGAVMPAGLLLVDGRSGADE